MEQLQVFSHDEFGSVRTLLIGNEPYFVGKDVTDILGQRTADGIHQRVRTLQSDSLKQAACRKTF